MHTDIEWGFKTTLKAKIKKKQSLTDGASRPRDVSRESGLVENYFFRFSRNLVFHHMLQMALDLFTVY
jgi:hypothetical protein